MTPRMAAGSPHATPPRADEREEWRAIEGFPRFQVSDFGRARRLTAQGDWVLCSQWPNTSGYPTIQVRNDIGVKRTAATHIFVAEAFIGRRPSFDHEVLHYDGDRTNARLSNLRYGTRAENSQDAIRHGTHTKFKLAEAAQTRARGEFHE